MILFDLHKNQVGQDANGGHNHASKNSDTIRLLLARKANDIVQEPCWEQLGLGTSHSDFRFNQVPQTPVSPYPRQHAYNQLS